MHYSSHSTVTGRTNNNGPVKTWCGHGMCSHCIYMEHGHFYSNQQRLLVFGSSFRLICIPYLFTTIYLQMINFQSKWKICWAISGTFTKGSNCKRGIVLRVGLDFNTTTTKYNIIISHPSHHGVDFGLTVSCPCNCGWLCFIMHAINIVTIFFSRVEKIIFCALFTTRLLSG